MVRAIEHGQRAKDVRLMLAESIYATQQVKLM